jgi:glycosyltransferase involved in cell wall biosynthesis
MAVALAWRSGNLPQNIDRYIALNRFAADKLTAGGVPKERIKILGNFIDTFIGRPENKKAYILFLGRLSPEKGLFTLLKALQKTNGVALKIAGSGSIEEDLKNYVRGKKDLNVEFVGFVSGEKKQSLIRHAFCAVVPSEWYENFPISILESLALGTPVIASKIGGLPEMVKHGKTGFLFNPGNTDELACSINQVVKNQDSIQRMSREALRTAKSFFDPLTHYSYLIDIYKETMRVAQSGIGVNDSRWFLKRTNTTNCMKHHS